MLLRERCSRFLVFFRVDDLIICLLVDVKVREGKIFFFVFLCFCDWINNK